MLFLAFYMPKSSIKSSKTKDTESCSMGQVESTKFDAPKQYCFAVCALGVQMCSKINGNDIVLQQFLCPKNQRAAFAAVLTEILKENVNHKFMLNKLVLKDTTILI